MAVAEAHHDLVRPVHVKSECVRYEFLAAPECRMVDLRVRNLLVQADAEVFKLFGDWVLGCLWNMDYTRGIAVR